MHPPAVHLLRRVRADHLDTDVEPEPDAGRLTGPNGAPLLRSNWYLTWKAVAALSRVWGLHFHDLRHTGHTLAAATGASTKELMARIGHSSARAALLYQHATRERDEAIALALSDLAEQATRRQFRCQAEERWPI